MSLAWRCWVGVWALGSSACLLLTDADPEQCRVDSDCGPLPGRLTRICEDRRCRPGCASNEQCAVFGDDYACPARGRDCQSLLSEAGECFSAHRDRAASSALTLEEVAVIGSFATQRSDSLPERLLQLATEELNATGGVPGAQGPLPVWVVVCQDGLDTLPGAMSHLIDDLGVRALLASLDPRVLREAFERQAADVDAFFLSPFNAWGTVQRSERLWYLLGGASDLFPAYQGVLDSVAAEVVDGTGAEPRVAALVADDELPDVQLAEAILGSAELGGVPLAALPDARFARFSLPNDETQRQASLRALVAQRPHVILAFASRLHAGSDPVAREQAVAEIEALWPPGELRPFYVLSPRNYRSEALAALVSVSPDWSERIVGINFESGVDDGLADALEQRFSARFREGDGNLIPSLYDGIYYLSYALSAVATDAAPSLGEAFRRLSADAPRVDVGPGPGGIDLAFALLRERRAFALHGVGGPPLFDPDAHFRPGGSQVYCLRSGDTGVEWRSVPLAPEAAHSAGECWAWGAP